MEKNRIAKSNAHLCAILALILFTTSSALAQSGLLRVSENQRYLEYTDGTPFFYLGDTAWQLIHDLDRDEVDYYLKNRRAKGFNVIQTVVVAQFGGVDQPNANGDLVFDDKDPAKPNEAYFRHVDYIVNRAESLGLFVGMLPTWGSHWKTDDGAYNVFTPENAHSYCRFLGARYKDKPIIWILGGDENIRNDAERAIIDAMASGLAEGDSGANLITFHPRGPGFSSRQVHDAAWLDFNMYQSSHAARHHDTGLYAEHDYALSPKKPTLDGEPRYESIPVGFYFDDVGRIYRFDDHDARQAAYWSLLAGACGHTYGNNNIWQMWKPGKAAIIGANIPWRDALDHPGAFQMGHLRKLFESRPWHLLEPDPALVVDGPTTGGAKIRAARASDGSFAFVYSPQGETFSVDVGRITMKEQLIKVTWFDPRYGVMFHVQDADTAGIQSYAPPTSGPKTDWLLILDDAAAGYPVTLPE